MPTKISLAHDFICPWCWVALIQVRKLMTEENVTVEWVGYELFPPDLEWPLPSPPIPLPANRPITPTRLEFLLAAEKITMPVVDRPTRMRTHNAHLACEFAKEHGVGFEFISSLYEAYWQEGKEINSVEVLCSIGENLGLDPKKLTHSIQKEKFAERIVPFDDEANRGGVYNVPTFFIGQERLAEQPYSVLKRALDAYKESAEEAPYKGIQFDPPKKNHPYVIMNMVSTIDGKTVSGTTKDDVLDLGSSVDHQAMRNLIASVDAVVIGAGTLRSTPKIWSPNVKYRFVITQSGALDYDHAFMQGTGIAVITPSKTGVKIPKNIERIDAGGKKVKPTEVLKELAKRDIKSVLILGGSETNAPFLFENLVDEVFLTIAPKMKLGRDLPTYAGGEPLPPESLLEFELMEVNRKGSELFLRYAKVKGHDGIV